MLRARTFVYSFCQHQVQGWKFLRTMTAAGRVSTNSCEQSPSSLPYTCGIRIGGTKTNMSKHFSCGSLTTVQEYSTHTHSAGSTLDSEEVEKFSRIAQTWWDEAGNFAALHSLNELRIPLVRDALIEHRKDALSCSSGSASLSGLHILDVGCGGGILSEPLARLGAEVTGIDASAENIAMATWHTSQDPQLSNKVQYQCTLVEHLAQQSPEAFDGVVASEILEHVADQEAFVESCSRLLKPGGCIFFTTINKTALSYALAVFAAENVLKLVPKGAHDWNKFIPPNNLQQMLTKCDVQTRLCHGMLLNPATLRWCWMKDTSMNYALYGVKSNSANDKK